MQFLVGLEGAGPVQLIDRGDGAYALVSGKLFDRRMAAWLPTRELFGVVPRHGSPPASVRTHSSLWVMINRGDQDGCASWSGDLELFVAEVGDEFEGAAEGGDVAAEDVLGGDVA